MSLEELKMKTIRLSYMLTLLLVLLPGSFPFASEGFSGLVVEVQSDKEDYLLGELVALKFRVINTSKAAVHIPKQTGVLLGNLQVFITYENGKFRRYRGPQWGTRDIWGTQPITLAPGAVYETEATILYNNRFETRHLNEAAAKPIIEEYIDTEYVLPKPGTYRIKATLSSDSSAKIESKPIEIKITEPQSIDDVAIWDVFKSDPEYAYFIQTGSLRRHSMDPKTRQMVETLERLVSFYSTSGYAGHIRSALSKHYSRVSNLKKQGLIKP